MLKSVPKSSSRQCAWRGRRGKAERAAGEGFMEKFGVMPFEGYGATELSPIVTVGFPDYMTDESWNIRWATSSARSGIRFPACGQVVDPDTFAAKGRKRGLLLVKAECDARYLNDPVKTAESSRTGGMLR